MNFLVCEVDLIQAYLNLTKDVGINETNYIKQISVIGQLRKENYHIKVL